MENSNKLIDKTIKDYNLIASKFSSTRNTITEDLFDIASAIDKTQSILDYGCGNGRMSELFDIKNYLGVDASEKLIDIAKNIHPGYRFHLIKPCQIDSNWKFENIICLSVIHHFPDTKLQRELISNFFEILSPGGQLIITAWKKQSNRADKLLSVPFKTAEVEIVRDIYCFSQKELENLVAECGFNVKSSSVVGRNRGRYSNFEVRATKPI